jgi:hypothetical protein
MRYAFIENNKITQVFETGQAFTLNGFSYPPNWLDLSTYLEKTEIGLVELTESVRPNPTYHSCSESFDIVNGVPSSVWVCTDLDVTTLKTELTNSVDKVMFNLLSPTDWYVTRFTEVGTAIPPEITANRAAIRSEYASLKQQIASSVTISDLETVCVNLPTIL